MRVVFVAVVLAAVLVAGCGTGAQPADPDQAREALQQALDAWQRGDKPATLKEARPALTVVEPRWDNGFRLVKYEIAEKQQANGFDQQLRATLWLQAPDGKPTQEKAIYQVSTRPARVVVRSEPG